MRSRARAWAWGHGCRAVAPAFRATSVKVDLTSSSAVEGWLVGWLDGWVVRLMPVTWGGNDVCLCVAWGDGGHRPIGGKYLRALGNGARATLLLSKHPSTLDLCRPTTRYCR